MRRRVQQAYEGSLQFSHAETPDTTTGAALRAIISHVYYHHFCPHALLSLICMAFVATETEPHLLLVCGVALPLQSVV